MRLGIILPSIALLSALGACSISNEIADRDAFIEQNLEAQLAPGSSVVQRVARYDQANRMHELRPAITNVDGLGTVVMAGYCPVRKKNETDPCAEGGKAVPLVGFCGLYRNDGRLQQFACPDGRYGLPLRSGSDLLLLGSEKGSYLVADGKPLTPVKLSYDDLSNIDTGVYGGAAEPWSILRTQGTYEGATGFGTTGFEVERVRFSEAGISSTEVIAKVTGTSASYATEKWVEEIEQGRLVFVYERTTGDKKELFYSDGGTEILVPILSAGGVHRTADGQLWFTSGNSLFRWNPAQGGAPEQVEVPSPTIDANWLDPMLGFFNSRAQVMTTEPGHPDFPVPVAYETMHFSGSGVVRNSLALTPCVTRAACREIGESYLLAVVGAGSEFRALYAFWPWETPKTYDPEGKTLSHLSMGMYLSPLRAPSDPPVPVNDAGLPEASPDASADGDLPEASLDAQEEASLEAGPEATIEAGPDAAFDAPTCEADGASTFCDGRDGRIYKQVTIEGQTWMADNLAFETPGSLCYGNDPNNCAKYGRLYRWMDAMAGAASTEAMPSGVQGVCPFGWHLPSKPEWGYLDSHVGPGSAGLQLMSAEMGGLDEWGFAVLGGGYASDTGSGPTFEGFSARADFWTTSESSPSTAWSRYFITGQLTMGETDTKSKELYFSLRCLKD